MAVSTDAQINLFGLSRAELEDFAKAAGQPAFRGRQLFRWLYGKGARSFDEMTNLPKAFRDHLAKHATINALVLDDIQFAADRTIKCLFKLPSGQRVESVLIPDFDKENNPKRLTVCVSSQVGCAMGCTFCATGLMGFKQNLNAAEIFDQVWQLNSLSTEHFGRPITNIVYMGMGEPMQNYNSVLQSTKLLAAEEGLGLSPKRITVSTVGLARRIKQLADDNTRFNLAVSLHAPTDDKRSSIMPVNRNERTDIGALMDSLKYYTEKTGRRITFEYCMFHEFNDTQEDAKELAALAQQIPSKVNLIMYNPVENVPFKKTSESRLNRFIQVLTKKGVLVTVRRSRGQDIDAACGQLLVKKEGTESESKNRKGDS